MKSKNRRVTINTSHVYVLDEDHKVVAANADKFYVENVIRALEKDETPVVETLLLEKYFEKKKKVKILIYCN